MQIRWHCPPRLMPMQCKHGNNLFPGRRLSLHVAINLDHGPVPSSYSWRQGSPRNQRIPVEILHEGHHQKVRRECHSKLGQLRAMLWLIWGQRRVSGTHGIQIKQTLGASSILRGISGSGAAKTPSRSRLDRTIRGAGTDGTIRGVGTDGTEDGTLTDANAKATLCISSTSPATTAPQLGSTGVVSSIDLSVRSFN